MKFNNLIALLAITVTALVAGLFASTLVADAHSESSAKASAECVNGQIELRVTTHNGQSLSQTVQVEAPVSGATPESHHQGEVKPGLDSNPFVFILPGVSTPGGTVTPVLDWTDGLGPDGIANTGDDQPDPHSASWNAVSCPVPVTTTTTTVYVGLIPPITIERQPETPKVSTGAPKIKVKKITDITG